jgi:predicted AAA+ superfamily ATPase
MKIRRIYNELDKFLLPNRALIIFGPRQVGKTTLMEDYLSIATLKSKKVTGDDIMIHQVLGSQSLTEIKSFCEGYDLVVIDEAQKIPNIGIAIKLMVDQIPGIRVLATGSSSFELAGQVGEPLTGRKTELFLYPVSQMELLNHFNRYELKQNLPDYLIYGCYPRVVTAERKSDKLRILSEITGSYLFRDILSFERIKSPQLLLDMLRLLAFQVGSEVSVNELSNKLGVDNKTVKKYLELLEKSFILFKLRGYSGNLRKEITRKSKYYFFDNGIRNAIIANFNSIDLRNDVGPLWENFLVAERLKKQAYQSIYANNFFWRSWSGHEVDFVEERDGKLFGYEFKWTKDRVLKPKLWLETYPQATFDVVSRENFLDFIV